MKIKMTFTSELQKQRGEALAIFNFLNLRNSNSQKKQTKASPETKQSAETTASKALSSSASTQTMKALSRIYDFMFSVEICRGIYQLEARGDSFSQIEIPAFGYYDELHRRLKGHMMPDDVGRFETLFDRRNIYACLSGKKTSICGEFAVNTGSNVQKTPDSAGAAEESNETTDPAPPSDTSHQWFRIEILRIAPPANGALRCFFLLRAIQDSQDDGNVPELLQPELFSDNGQQERIRAQKLLGGSHVMFFEYHIAEDTFCLHREPGNLKGDRQIKNYLATLLQRCDWTVFHSDVLPLRQLLDKGEGVMELRYRTRGDYDAPFQWHRIRCAPLEEDGKPTQILGAISNIDEEVRQRENTHRLSIQLGTLIDTAFTYVAEIDTVKGTTARISMTEGNYEREHHPHSLRGFILEDINNGVIHPDSAEEYKKWIQPGFLTSVTANGHNYSVETQLKLPGNSEYGWYTENIACPDPAMPNYFLRMRRNITELHEQQQRNIALQQQVQFAKYNQTVIDSLSSLVEFRDAESGEHVQRVRSVVKLLLENMRDSGMCPDFKQDDIHQICSAAAMHDVGKIAISDAILNKPGRLTPEEFEIMKTHTTKGAAIIDKLDLTGSETLRVCCRDITLHHHERYDGNGYPEHLKGDEISIAAQVVGLADVYDALVSVRCYKKKFSYEEAMRMIQNNECGVFNPKLLAVLKQCANKCRQIYEEPEKESSNTQL